MSKKINSQGERILHLTLKKQWFDMISKGEKKEEYREIKDYWIKRLKYVSITQHFEAFIPYDKIVFKNGYGKHVPTMIVEFKGIRIGKGNKEWGADDKVLFCIKLGNILYDSTRVSLIEDAKLKVLNPKPSGELTVENKYYETNRKKTPQI